MNTEVAVSRPSRPISFAPQNLGELMEFAKLIANTDFVPKEYRGRVADIIVCIQFGAEIGLSPIQALHSVSVINTKPSVWGDGAIALVQASGLLEDHAEDVEGEGDERFGWCRMVRKGRQTAYFKRFSIRDAKVAGLHGKNVWKSYPDVMLVARARSACMRAGFSDVLKGITPREEAIDYPSEEEQIQEAKPTSDLPWAERASAQAALADEGTKDTDLQAALVASLAVAQEDAAPVSVPTGTNLPRSEGVVSSDGAAPSLLLDDLEEEFVDEPVLINEKDRRYFHVCREEGHHPKDSAKQWLQNTYGISSTSEIHKDWLRDICARLRDPMPL